MDSYTYASVAGRHGRRVDEPQPGRSATGTFVLHTTLSSLSSSPGTRASGSAF